MYPAILNIPAISHSFQRNLVEVEGFEPSSSGLVLPASTGLDHFAYFRWGPQESQSMNSHPRKRFAQGLSQKNATQIWDPVSRLRPTWFADHTPQRTVAVGYATLGSSLPSLVSNMLRVVQPDLLLEAPGSESKPSHPH